MELALKVYRFETSCDFGILGQLPVTVIYSALDSASEIMAFVRYEDGIIWMSDKDTKHLRAACESHLQSLQADD